MLLVDLILFVNTPPPPPKRMHMLLHTRSGLYSGAAEEQIKQFTPNLRSEA